ncbi:MAG: hypothetical protein MUP81_04615 [Dehalococcoidia bacterium]|nr:hypothetical protein [Dehalococcoidia bacterium]
MSESTLKMTWTEIETEVARFLGFDRTSSNWTASQVLDMAAIIKRGMRQFYFPMRLNAQEPAHRWSFLRPQTTLVIWDDLVAADAITATITYASPVSTVTASAAAFYPSMEGKTLKTASGNSFVIFSYTSSTVVTVTGDASADTGDVITVDSEDTFTLPWDFGGMAGDGFTYDVDNSKINRIKITTDVRIRQLRQSSVSTGTPYLACIVPLATDMTKGQRWEAMFHNPPSEELTLHYRYYILPDALTKTTYEYPYGSAVHSETILESCLAVAEEREKDAATTLHREKFARLLQSSIDHDKTLSETANRYGYNGDDSDGPADGSVTHEDFLVTFNGV